MESQPQNPEFRNNPENFTHENTTLEVLPNHDTAHINYIIIKYPTTLDVVIPFILSQDISPLDPNLISPHTWLFPCHHRHKGQQLLFSFLFSPMHEEESQEFWPLTLL